MPTLTVLVGLPGSGKSTSIPTNFDGFIYSTDKYIEEQASREGLTYNACFDRLIKEATSVMNTSLQLAISGEKDVIWDQTNLSAKKRKGIYSQFPNKYRKVCICRVPPRSELEWRMLSLRLSSRPGKTIPDFVFSNMAKTFVIPDKSEGFDEVILLDMFGENLE